LPPLIRINNKRGQAHLPDLFYWSGQKWPQICIETRAGIVIALKRNGAYADNIQVSQLGSIRVV
jgi:hypothetical protein